MMKLSILFLAASVNNSNNHLFTGGIIGLTTFLKKGSHYCPCSAVDDEKNTRNSALFGVITNKGFKNYNIPDDLSFFIPEKYHKYFGWWRREPIIYLCILKLYYEINKALFIIYLFDYFVFV